MIERHALGEHSLGGVEQRGDARLEAVVADGDQGSCVDPRASGVASVVVAEAFRQLLRG